MMKRTIRYFLALSAMLVACIIPARSQVLLESVAAVVGNEVIYLSDLENMVADMRRSDPRLSPERIRCDYFQQMLVSKLFLDQA
ncbi:MAG: hypothetical protein ACM3UT_04420, partial [Chloroflexota bacterium]